MDPAPIECSAQDCLELEQSLAGMLSFINGYGGPTAANSSQGLAKVAAELLGNAHPRPGLLPSSTNPTLGSAPPAEAASQDQGGSPRSNPPAPSSPTSGRPVERAASGGNSDSSSSLPKVAAFPAGNTAVEGAAPRRNTAVGTGYNNNSSMATGSGQPLGRTGSSDNLQQQATADGVQYEAGEALGPFFAPGSPSTVLKRASSISSHSEGPAAFGPDVGRQLGDACKAAVREMLREVLLQSMPLHDAADVLYKIDNHTKWNDLAAAATHMAQHQQGHGGSSNNGTPHSSLPSTPAKHPSAMTSPAASPMIMMGGGYPRGPPPPPPPPPPSGGRGGAPKPGGGMSLSPNDSPTQAHSHGGEPVGSGRPFMAPLTPARSAQGPLPASLVLSGLPTMGMPAAGGAGGNDGYGSPSSSQAMPKMDAGAAGFLDAHARSGAAPGGGGGGGGSYGGRGMAAPQGGGPGAKPPGGGGGGGGLLEEPSLLSNLLQQHPHLLQSLQQHPQLLSAVFNIADAPGSAASPGSMPSPPTSPSRGPASSLAGWSDMTHGPGLGGGAELLGGSGGAARFGGIPMDTLSSLMATPQGQALLQALDPAAAAAAGYSCKSFDELSLAVRDKVESILETCAPHIRAEHFDAGVRHWLLQLQTLFGEGCAVQALHAIETAANLEGVRRMKAFITTRLIDHYEQMVWAQDPQGYAMRKLTPDLICVLEELVHSDKGLRWTHFDPKVLDTIREIRLPDAVRTRLSKLCAQELAGVQNVPAYLYTLLSKRGKTAKQAAAAKQMQEFALRLAATGQLQGLPGGPMSPPGAGGGYQGMSPGMGGLGLGPSMSSGMGMGQHHMGGMGGMGSPGGPGSLPGFGGYQGLMM